MDMLSTTKNPSFNILEHDPVERHTYDEFHPLARSIGLFMGTHVKDMSDVVVSLSGGPDSMVVTLILKAMGYNIIACHINYGNREEANLEQRFVERECNEYGIVLETRIITEATRGSMSRTEYEKMTSEIRFSFYHEMLNKYDAHSVVYGHHRGDMFENILTNSMIRGRSMLDLVVIKPIKIKNNVPIWRPMLSHYKRDIFDYAHKNNVPYLKDTTPDWSARWKTRNIVRPALTDMGMNVENIVKSALKAEQLGELVKDQLISPIINKCYIGSNCFSIGVKDVPENVALFEMVMRTLFHSIKISQLPAKNMHKLHNMLRDQSLKDSMKKITIKKDINCYLWKNWFIVTSLDWKPMITISESSLLFPGKTDTTSFIDGTWCYCCTSMSIPTIVNSFSKKKKKGIIILPKIASVIYIPGSECKYYRVNASLY
jgi:tRNA(Ile)-lysidine synthetase-like protein